MPVPVLLAGIGVVCAGAVGLQTLHVPLQDSHFDLGFAQGRHFRPTLSAYLNSSNDLQRVLLPFCAAAGNATKCASLRRSAERAFPDYAAELRGLAAGARVPEAWLWALNMADEIHSLRGGFPHEHAAPLAGAGGTCSERQLPLLSSAGNHRDGVQQQIASSAVSH